MVINDVISSGATLYNVVYYITMVGIDRAGNVTADTKAIHIIDNRTGGFGATTSSGDNYAVITQGASFELPSIRATLLLDVMSNQAIAYEDYTLVYTLDGKEVEGIDTLYSGVYRVYAVANVNCEEISQLVYTLKITDRYVEAFDIDDNYWLLIVNIAIGLLFIAGCIFVCKKKRLF